MNCDRSHRRDVRIHEAIAKLDGKVRCIFCGQLRKESVVEPRHCERCAESIHCDDCHDDTKYVSNTVYCERHQ